MIMARVRSLGFVINYRWIVDRVLNSNVFKRQKHVRVQEFEAKGI